MCQHVTLAVPHSDNRSVKKPKAFMLKLGHYAMLNEAVTAGMVHFCSGALLEIMLT